MDKDTQIQLRKDIYKACLEQKKESELKKLSKQHNTTQEILRKTLNVMVQKKFLLLFKDSNTGEMVFQSVPQNKIAALQQLGDFEVTLYQIIDKSGDMGITKKDLGRKIKKPTKIIDNSLKLLMSKNLIKAVQSIKSRQTVIMKFDIEPNREITGGIWYTENMTFNSKLISSLQRATVEYLMSHHLGTAIDILKEIKASGISSSVELQEQDMRQIINTLIYDGLIEESPESRESQPIYRIMRGVETTNPFSEIPCANCPVFSECTPSGDVNPFDCIYLGKWSQRLEW